MCSRCWHTITKITATNRPLSRLPKPPCFHPTWSWTKSCLSCASISLRSPPPTPPTSRCNSPQRSSPPTRKQWRDGPPAHPSSCDRKNTKRPCLILRLPSPLILRNMLCGRILCTALPAPRTIPASSNWRRILWRFSPPTA